MLRSKESPATGLPPRRTARVAPYALALLAVAVAIVLRVLLEPLLGDRIPFVTLFAAVAFVSWHGGRGPALLTLVAGAIGVAVVILQPRYELTVDEPEYVVGLVLYLIVGWVSIVLFESLRKAQQAAEEKRRELAEEVAQRRLAQQALAEREGLLRTTLASIGDAVITADIDGKVMLLNTVAAALTGWTRAEARGQPLAAVFNIVDETTRRTVENPVAKVLREGRIVGLANHTVLIGRDGSERPIDDSAAPIRDGQGRIFGVVLTFREVIEGRRAQAALAASAERFRLAVEAVNGIIYEYDLQTGHVERTRGLFEVLGYRPEEVPHTAAWWWEQIHPEDRPGKSQAFEQATQAAQNLVTQYRVRHKHGRWLHVEDRAVLLRDGAGTPLKLVGCTVDITERKRAEAALREADRRKDEFLAVLSHELRNPLAPIRNALQVLKTQDLADPKLAWSRDVIERQVAHTARLLDDLLDVARITRGQLALRKERIALGAVVARALETSRPAIDAAGHELTVALPDEPIALDADADRLAQVFSNLLNNAAKYTHPGGRIRLGVEREAQAAVVSVADSGLGIAPELRPHLFEMFSQATLVMERAQGGLGLGLALAKRLVEMHGGSIEAHSAGPGQGSDFIVRLPIAAVEPPVVEPARSDDAGERPPTARRSVLIVDDLKDSADSLAMLLEASGYDVHTAYGGEAAIAAAEALEPDVMRLDLGMPKVNGFDVCRVVRSQPWGRDMLLVALTGWGQAEDRHRSRDAGFDAHLIKPVEPAALFALLRASRPECA
jgi:PAS domain S-box-containing protein